MNKNIDLNNILKESAKTYNLKKIDFLLWTIKDNLIFSIFSHFIKIEDTYYLKVLCEFKPIWADEIFWKIMINPKFILDLEKKPLSYRVIGVDSAPMKEIYSNQVELSRLDSEDEIQAKHDNEIEVILNTINNISEKDYTGKTEFDLITAVYNEDYKNARQILKGIPNPYKFNGTLKTNETHVNTWIFTRAVKKYIRFKK